MRNLFLALPAAAILAWPGAAPVCAQTYDPNYPVCLLVYAPEPYNRCSFTSLAQCNASASGRAAQCVANPFFANANRGPGRRQHRAY